MTGLFPFEPQAAQKEWSGLPRSRTKPGPDGVPFLLHTTSHDTRGRHPAAARGRVVPPIIQNFRAVMIWLNVYSPSSSPGQSTFTWVRAEIVLLA